MRSKVWAVVGGVAVAFAMATSAGAEDAKEVTPWVAPEEAAKVENPLKSTAEVIAAGKKNYDMVCFVCHGTTGKGDGVGGAALNPKPANFTSKKVQDQSDGAIFYKMSEGRGLMVSYKSMFKDEQRWQLVHYIRELARLNAEAEKKAEKKEAKTE